MIKLKNNHNNNRCDPIVMIAGKIGGFQNSATSFKTCIQDIQPTIYSEIKNTYNKTIKDISNVTSEMAYEQSKFLTDLEETYAAQNTQITKGLTDLSNNKSILNKKIANTNTTITNTYNKINKLL